VNGARRGTADATFCHSSRSKACPTNAKFCPGAGLSGTVGCSSPAGPTASGDRRSLSTTQLRSFAAPCSSLTIRVTSQRLGTDGNVSG
jgi:hypothetical protein